MWFNGTIHYIQLFKHVQQDYYVLQISRVAISDSKINNYITSLIIYRAEPNCNFTLRELESNWKIEVQMYVCKYE
jgi:hypothetical protein